MNIKDDLFQKYLMYLGVSEQILSFDYLCKLQLKQIQKFPFENISKLILHYNNDMNGLINFDSHLNNSIKSGTGGTCYANNYYFNRLLNYLGFNAELHGAEMLGAEDVHIVNIVHINDRKYLVDAGYGAPFYKPLQLFTDAIEINWGKLCYMLDHTKDNCPRVTVLKNDNMVHRYIVRLFPRKIDYFHSIIKASYHESSEFMNCIRVIRYFDDYGIELINNKYSVHHKNISEEYFINTIEELESVADKEFKLPGLQVRSACDILLKHKNINIFENKN